MNAGTVIGDDSVLAGDKAARAIGLTHKLLLCNLGASVVVIRFCDVLNA